MSCKNCGAREDLSKQGIGCGVCTAEALSGDDYYIVVTCDTCQESFIIRDGQALEHQTEREHSGRMRTVHVIAEEDRP